MWDFINLRLGFAHRANTINESYKMNLAIVKGKGEQISRVGHVIDNCRIMTRILDLLVIEIYLMFIIHMTL